MNRVAPRELNRKFSRVPTPTAAILELTNRCNLECVHCVRESPTLRFDDELSTDEWLFVLGELKSINTFGIAFTGGEATTHPDLFALIDRARALGMSVSIKTNGLTLEKIAADLAAAGVGMIDVSLYGATAATHERCTGVSRSLERTVAGIQAARRAGISVTINITLFRWNVHELDTMFSLARELDCRAQRDYLLATTDLGRHFVDDLCTPEQMRFVEGRRPLFSLSANQNGCNGIKKCAQGINRMAITARGEILSCITLRKPIGHVREGIASVWEREAGRAHAIEHARFRRCNECDYLPKCNVCLGHNFSATGDLYEPPLERCLATMAMYGAAA